MLNTVDFDKSIQVRLDKATQTAKCDPRHGWKQGQGKCVRVEKKQKTSSVAKTSKKALFAATITLAGAGLAGKATFEGAKQYYKKRIDKGVPLIKERVEELNKNESFKLKKNQKAVVVGVGGISQGESSGQVRTGERMGLAFKLNYQKDKKNTFKTVPVNNSSWNPPEYTAKVPHTLSVTRATAAAYINRMSQDGGQAGREVAAQAISWADNTEKNIPIVLSGHSAGGYDVREAMDYIAKMRPDLEPRIKAFSFGTAYHGLSSDHKNSFTIANKKDPETVFFPHSNRIVLGDAEGHSQNNYFRSQEGKEFIKKQIWGD